MYSSGHFIEQFPVLYRIRIERRYDEACDHVLHNPCRLVWPSICRNPTREAMEPSRLQSQLSPAQMINLYIAEREGLEEAVWECCFVLSR
jgi:hypothetical protein